MKLVQKNFKCELSIIALFEAQLFKNNRVKANKYYENKKF